MHYFYQSGAMGYYGEGWYWHKFVKPFPKNVPIVTKTVTMFPIKGVPLILPLGKSIWNKVGLVNPGIDKWIEGYFKRKEEGTLHYKLILSLYGSDEEIQNMIYKVQLYGIELHGIELNYSCPNAIDHKNCCIPYTKYPLYLKLNHTQNPMSYYLGNVYGIRVNSVPMYKGGVSGKKAQEYNWSFLKKCIESGIHVSGCSFTSIEDVHRLIDMGCTSVGIGSAIITNPDLVRTLLNEK